MRELFITGLQSFSHYGTEVVGMDVKQLQKARANHLSLVGATCKSAKTNLSLAALGDPLWRQALGPALTWSTLVWKATTHANYRDVVTVPELGRLAGPIMLKLPRTWGEVRGPVGAAALSLRRVGWTFDTCLTLVTDEGVHLPLTSTSPAMVAYHLQVSWKRRLGEAAARSLGLDGEQLDPTVFQRELKTSQAGQAFPLLKAFITQAVWSTARLRRAGYDVDASCPHCGSESDTLHHRLFHCPATSELRDEYFGEHELQDILCSPEARHLLMGFQLLPPRLARLPDGLGFEQFESWTLTGAPIHEVLRGEVFTDGSCFKEGPVTWHRTGWSVVKVALDGVLLAWMRGVVGRALPQTSPASEHVAGVAAATAPGGGITKVNSDYQGLEHVEEQPPHLLYSRSQLYAGPKMLIVGRRPPNFRIHKVQGHADIDGAPTARARFEAIGNDHADRVARAAASELTQPSPAELQQWHGQRHFLQRYMKYLPRALSRWPAIGPTVGKRSLPKRAAACKGQEPAKGQASFIADVLGEYGAMHSRAQAALRREHAATDASGIGTTPNGIDPELDGGSRARDAAAARQQMRPPDQRPEVAGGPPIEPLGQESFPPSGGREAVQSQHDWMQVNGRWTCRSCMTISRATFPPVGHCPGLTPTLADLISDPRGHTLQIAPYSDGSSIIVICSRCGHFAGSKRRNTKLHTDVCKRAFASDGARYAYQRVCDRMHPTYGKGPSKVLEPCIPAASLAAGRLDAAAGVTGAPET